MIVPGSASALLLKSAAPTGYNVERSLRFNSSDSAYVSRSVSSQGNLQTWTLSAWIKRSALGGTNGQYILHGSPSGSNQTFIRFNTDNTLQFLVYLSSSTAGAITTSAVYRDLSAWLHLVAVLDTTNATASERMRLYINGGRITAFSSSTTIAQNTNGTVNSVTTHEIGRNNPVISSDYLNGYLADIHFIDGQALDPTSFGEFDANGTWQPKAYTGTYGTNGFHLPFSDNSTAAALGTDTSGNGNTWTVNNISVAAGAGNDSLVDTPTSYGTDTGAVRGNYATWNVLDANATLANGNLETSAPAGYRHARCTIAMPPGKWYAEFTTGAMLNGTATPRFGVVDNTRPLTDSDWQSGGYGIDLFTSQNTSFAGKFSASAGVTVLVTQSVTPFNTGDVVGIAYDADTGKIWFSLNGTWLYSGNPASGTTPVAQLDTTRILFFHVEDYSSSSIANFGQRPFAYPAPSGYKALCTTNLPEPQTITTSGSYTGNGVADGPFVYLNGVPTAMTVNGTAVTFGTHADKLSNGFKVRTTSTTYNQNAATYNYSVTSTGPTFKTARAQAN